MAIESRKGIPFSRLKLTKSLWYISLACGDLKSEKKFQRFDIADVSDIKKYTNEIVTAFRFCDKTHSKQENVEVTASDLSPDLKSFFSKISQLSFKEMKSFSPNQSEIIFFNSFIEKLKESGLNWENVTVELMADGAIRTRGGRIKLGKRSSYMQYTKPGDALSTKEKNLELSEYISLQKYWIDECLSNKELYNL